MRRVMQLAEYPARLIAHNPIPANAMPTVRTEVALQYVYPDEDTSDDNLDNNSELDVDIYDTSGNIEHGVLHAGGTGEWANSTEHTVTYTLVNTTLTLATIDHMVLNFGAACTTSILGNCIATDQWHMQAVEVYGYKDSSAWERRCYFRGFQNATSFDVFGIGHPQPEVVFKQDNSSQTLSKSSGCL
jgi:hypothetical protein